jgi:Ca2+-binding EF-hand superfamily protein
MIGSVSGNTNRLSIDPGSLSSSQRHAAIFKKLDVNGDGTISKAELGVVASGNRNGKDAAAIMNEVDTNGDGGIDQAENDAFLSKLESQGKPKMPPPGQGPRGGNGVQSGNSSEDHSKIFDELDTNKDGKVSLQELMAAATDETASSELENLLKSMDVDADGSISKGELDSFLTKLEEEMKLLSQPYGKDGKGIAAGPGQTVDAVV